MAADFNHLILWTASVSVVVFLSNGQSFDPFAESAEAFPGGDEGESCPLLGAKELSSIKKSITGKSSSKAAVCLLNKAEVEKQLSARSAYCIYVFDKFSCVIKTDLKEAESRHARGGGHKCPKNNRGPCTQGSTSECREDWRTPTMMKASVCYNEITPKDFETTAQMYFIADENQICQLGPKDVLKILEHIRFIKWIPKCTKNNGYKHVEDAMDRDEDVKYPNNKKLSLTDKVKGVPNKAKNTAKKKVQKYKKQANIAKNVAGSALKDAKASVQVKFNALTGRKRTILLGEEQREKLFRELNFILQHTYNPDHDDDVDNNAADPDASAVSIEINRIGLIPHRSRRRERQVAEETAAGQGVQVVFTAQYPAEAAAERDLRADVKSVVETASDNYESKVVPGLRIDKSSIIVSKVRILKPKVSSKDNGEEINYTFIGGGFVLGVCIVALAGFSIFRRHTRKAARNTKAPGQPRVPASAYNMYYQQYGQPSVSRVSGRHQESGV